MEMSAFRAARSRMREERKKNADTAKKRAMTKPTEKDKDVADGATNVGPDGGRYKIIKGGKKVYLPKNA